MEDTERVLPSAVGVSGFGKGGRIGSDPGLHDEIIRENTSRFATLTLLAIPVHLLFIIIFAFFLKPSSEAEIRWRAGIIACHSAFLCLMCVFLFLGKGKWIETKPVRIQSFFQAFFLLALQVGGAAITIVDQSVTSSITPFMITCSIAAMVFRITPVHAAGMYFFAFSVFALGLGITQHDTAILLSNRINGFAITAMGAGLNHILWWSRVKSIFQHRTIRRQRDELEKKNVRLSFLASHDPLTELCNRREFDRFLKMEMSRIFRYGRRAVVILLDIDFFKAVNDSYGHSTGDAVLVQTADILRRNLRESDIIARWGGEEFIVLLPETELIHGIVAAEKLRTVVGNNFMVVNGNTIRVTASFGVVALDTQAGMRFDLVYQEADKALYSAKANGRNRVEVAE